jgi:hypothetical protein
LQPLARLPNIIDYAPCPPSIAGAGAGVAPPRASLLYAPADL